MKKKRYLLLMLDGKAVLDGGEVRKVEETGNYQWSFSYDFSEQPLLKRKLVASTQHMYDCALYYQFEKLLPSEKRKHGESCLMHHLLYVDFTGVFMPDFAPDIEKLAESGKDYRSLTEKDLKDPNHIYDNKLRWLFDESSALTITFEDGETVEFVPFDKSASMARQCRMTFVDKKYMDKLDERIRMGISFQDVELIQSKYYAYRGLYLSTSQRIEQDESFVLDERTVIVIHDMSVILHAGQTGFLEGTLPEGVGTGQIRDPYWTIRVKKDGTLNATAFDGEGFISPEYAALVNRQLLGLSAEAYRDAENELLYCLGKRNARMPEQRSLRGIASSLQIRMPFSKGMLHSVDFRQFLADNGVSDSSTITDAFGIERSVKDARIILTVSMFKCKKWLSMCWEAAGKEYGDPMKFFFERMKKYDHTLYVANTGASYSTASRIKLNYQFLNTLEISADDFESLCLEHLTNANELLTDADRQKRYLLHTDNTGEDMSGETLAPDRFQAQPWRYAVSRNDAFLTDPLVREEISRAWRSLEQDCALGRIEVCGECRFLSHDLLRLLTWLGEQCGMDAQRKAALKKLCLYQNRFYLPNPRMTRGRNGRELDPTRHYAILRNPHLSRNEQCALMPLVPGKSSPYRKYLSHLDGVVMVGVESLAPMALSGADFDGDLVKLTDNEIIVRAILAGVYEAAGEAHRYQRRLSVITIPSPGAESRKPERGIGYYKVIRNSFSNRIGHISNTAIRLGKLEYDTKVPPSVWKDILSRQHACASCTFVTGLEIDAAKTGVHPEANLAELDELLKETCSAGKDYFLSAKEKLLELFGGSSFKVEGGYDYEISGTEGAKALTVIPPESGKLGGNLDCLPYYFARNHRNRPRKPSKAGNPRMKFNFQANGSGAFDPGWKDKTEAAQQEQVRLLMEAYKAIGLLSHQLHETKKRYANTKYYSCVLTLLQMQYDDLSQKVPGTQISVEAALDSIYALLDPMLDSAARVDAALDRMIRKQWQFTPQEKRAEVLKDILGVQPDDEQVKLLTNFNCYGFRLLYYILKNIKTNLGTTLTADSVSLGRMQKKLALNPYYPEFKKIFRDATEKKLPGSAWRPELRDACAKKLNLIFGCAEQSAEQLLYVAAASETEADSRFLWEIFNEELLLESIYHPGYALQERSEGTENAE